MTSTRYRSCTCNRCHHVVDLSTQKPFLFGVSSLVDTRKQRTFLPGTEAFSQDRNYGSASLSATSKGNRGPRTASFVSCSIFLYFAKPELKNAQINVSFSLSFFLSFSSLSLSLPLSLSHSLSLSLSHSLSLTLSDAKKITYWFPSVNLFGTSTLQERRFSAFTKVSPTSFRADQKHKKATQNIWILNLLQNIRQRRQRNGGETFRPLRGFSVSLSLTHFKRSPSQRLHRSQISD